MGQHPTKYKMLDETIHGIYGSITDPLEWTNILKNIDIITNSSCSTLISARRHDQPHFNMPSTIDGRQFTQYQKTLMSKDNVANHVRRIDPGRVIASSDFLGMEGAKQSTVYREFYAECGFLHFIGANLIISDIDWISIISFRGPGSTPYDQTDRDIFSHIVPHMLRSMQVSQYITDKDAEAETAMLGFDAIHHAAFLLDRDYRMVSTNRSGRGLIDTGDVGVDHDGRLYFVTGSEASIRHRQPLLVLESGNTESPSIIRTNTGRKLAVTVSETPECDRVSPSGLSEKTNQIALIFDIDTRFKAIIEDVRREFGLTQAEKRIYEASLYQSNSLDIAESLCLSRETVRTHLKNIFSKVGVSRHVDLVQNFVHRTPADLDRFAN